MKSTFNPISYMLLAYKGNMGDLYENSFRKTNIEMNQAKLQAFCKSLVSIMKFKGFNNFSYSLNEKGIDIFNNQTLIVTYDITFVAKIKSEISLKLQLLAEWGLLMELNKKEQLLIAL